MTLTIDRIKQTSTRELHQLKESSNDEQDIIIIDMEIRLRDLERSVNNLNKERAERKSRSV